MKVTMQNLGVIKQAEIDLKPLTILIGPNNAGKTWLAYTLAGIFGSYGYNRYIDAYVEERLAEHYPPLDTAVADVLAHGTSTLDLIAFAEHYGESYFQHLADYAQQWMPDFLSTQHATFADMKITIALAESQKLFLEKIKQSTIQIEVAGGAFGLSKEADKSVLQAYTSLESGEVITDKIPLKVMKKYLVRNVMRIFNQALYTDVRIFPTERTALITFHLESSVPLQTQTVPNEKTKKAVEEIIHAIKQLQELEGVEIKLPERKQGIMPVGYFANMLGELFQIGSRESKRREKAARTHPEIQRYQQLAQMLEEEILAGKLEFSTPEPDPRRDILFRPQEGITLEMPIVSSMVKELATLVFYLRYLAQPGELLIIDEPEMNLHPEAQVKIIEFLTQLVNAGLRVLITTHSPYLLDHLSNLIEAAQHKEEEEQKSLSEIFLLESSNAFIFQDAVSVYLVNNGTTENLLEENGRIDWSTFGDVGDRVANIHSML